jgi:hypothetical protein
MSQPPTDLQSYMSKVSRRMSRTTNGHRVGCGRVRVPIEELVCVR